MLAIVEKNIVGSKIVEKCLIELSYAIGVVDHISIFLEVDNNLDLEKKNRLIQISGKKELNPIELNIPGDPSSAAFFTTLALLNKKSSLFLNSSHFILLF